METDKGNLLLLGLPETGKTTFLIALDETLQDPRDGSGLRSGGFAGNRNYITGVRDAWLRGETVGRTVRSATAEPAELIIENPETGKRTHLTLPDVSGEMFEDQWETHTLSAEYRVQLAKTDGVLLFVSALRASRNETIESAWATSQPFEAKSWERREAGSQVKIVGLLQLIAECEESRCPMRVAVLISAWDVIEKAPYGIQKMPTKYLETEWPLLSQYLSSNSEDFSFQVYGVSARGGDDAAQADLLKLFHPSDRVKLIEDNAITKDLTRPLRWLLA